ncbi:MAG: HAD family phosphatase [Oscillospiraceae bacterium]|nr:HAD family phosphatase [Oscillospiraceae bacterium]
MNYIFDIGNVLVTYEPRKYLEGLFADETAIDLILHNVYLSDEWQIADEGKLTRDEMTKIFCERLPQYKNEVINLMKNVSDMFKPLDTMKLLPKIKDAGHKLYYLSNITFDVRDYLVETYDFIGLFEGGIFSCDERIIKPNPEIYRLLLRRYNLNASDCIFFDDLEKNINAAEKEGIKGVVFTSAECVEF